MSTAVKSMQPSTTLHAKRFPGETQAYRAARDELLRAEMALRRNIEEVASLRRRLPPGGAVAQDYAFEEVSDAGRSVRLSELFVRPEASLVLYSFMYGPKMQKACPSCTSILDALDRTATHATQRINLAVVAKSPPARIAAHARDRGWGHLHLLSSANNSYNRDYHGEDEQGAQMPALNVFTRRDGVIRHTFCTELLFVAPEPGQNPRHADLIWPLWNLFDFTPEGRGADWHPSLQYDKS